MLAALIPALLPFLGTILERVIPDKAEAARELAKIEASLVEQANAQALAQIDLNKTEAAHGSIFVAGWRPFIGWVGGAGLAWAFIVQPVATWALAIWAPGTSVPSIVTDNLFELVLAMLGLGGMRTFEKIRGVTVNMPGSVQPAAVARPITADELNAASLARARTR
jgi:hypothetical protein